MVAEKIVKFTLAEFFEAFLFIVALLIVGMLPEDNIRNTIQTMLIFSWAILGIGTPFIIFFELEKEIVKLFDKF
jgi:hypothetical protein